MALSPPAARLGAGNSRPSVLRALAAYAAFLALAWSFLAPHAAAHRSNETFRDVACSLSESHPNAPAHLESAEAGIHSGCLACWMQLGTGAALATPTAVLAGLSRYGSVASAGVVPVSPILPALAPARGPPSLPRLSA